MAIVAGMTGLKGSLPGVDHKLIPRMLAKVRGSRRIKVCRCSWSSSSQATRSSKIMDPYTILRIQPDASESEARKAFRQLALQYHPDVCKENNSGVQFHIINEAYDAVMNNLRERDEEQRSAELLQTHNNVAAYHDEDEAMRGMLDPEYDMWEEWMGWEGAGIRDYSSHINPYI